MLKNYKPFFINISYYRDISVQIRQLFAHFRPVKFWSRNRAPPSLVCIKQLQALWIVFKFQLCTSDGFWVIGELINFLDKNCRFMFFASQLTVTWLKIPKIAIHDAFINFYAESKFQLSGFYRLLVISKPILICQNSPTKTKLLRAYAKSQLQSKWFTTLLCAN